MLSKIKDILLYAGQGKEQYEKVKPELIEANRGSIMLFSIVAILLSAIMYSISFASPALVSSRICYIIIIVFSVLTIILANTVVKRKPNFVYVLVFLYSTMMLCVCATFATIIEPNREAVSFAVMIFGIPLLFIDIPLRIILLTVTNMIIFVVVSWRFQSPEMFAYNVTTILPYGIIGIFIDSFLVSKKIQSFVLQDKTAIMDQILKLNADLEKSNKEVEQARRQAEENSAAKTSFLFNMSHDIRTPMNAIIGFRDLLEKHQEEPEKRANYLRKIEDASSVLLSIINNVLEMSRIEKGTLKIDETVWSADQLKNSMVSIFADMMNQKGLEFKQEVRVEHQYVYCDTIKLREIYINIISNAYKYTNEGSVTMRIEELPYEREGWVLYRTSISDTGIGMDEDFLPHIFDEFAREHNTTDAKIEGTGLGMSIVKRLVEILDGTIDVKSEKGVGSTIAITIPHRIAEKENLVVRAGINLDPKFFEGKRILLAEDNELNAEIAIEILQEMGFIVDHANDGVECCKMLEEKPDYYYNIILMDIQMPNMNGYDATRAIRRMENAEKANIPIVAMTANAFEEDKREAFRSGMNGHIAKPVNVPTLLKEVISVIR